MVTYANWMGEHHKWNDVLYWDITPFVSMVSKFFMEYLGYTHWKALDWVLKYLNLTISFRLV